MQTTTTRFDSLLANPILPISWGLRISFTKAYDSDITFFTLDQSTLDGGDVLAPNGDNPIQQWDYYSYQNFSDRLISVSWENEVEFPYSVTSALADFKLENHDGYFTPNSASPIADYILPKRPVRILSGLGGINLPQFIGLTEKMPVIDSNTRTVSFQAMDFLSKIYTMPTTETLSMQNVRTDEVLAVIFEQLGMTAEQYSLSKGRNIIKFVFYDKKTNIGKIIRDLMQAEGGRLWFNELGIIIFEPRLNMLKTPVLALDSSNIVEIRTIDEDIIINTVKIYSEIRELQASQPIWTIALSLVPIIVKANSSLVFKIDLLDPCQTINEPTLGKLSTDSWFTVSTVDSVEVISNVSITGSVINTNNYVLFFSNTNAFDVIINDMEVWGEPAKVVDTIEYKEINQASIEKYEEKLLEISNSFIQSVDACDSLALTTLDEFAEYGQQIEIQIKPNPALQLGDVLSVDYESYDGQYRIYKITQKIMSGGYSQVLKARKYTPRNWFTLDYSTLDGTDVLAP